MNSNPVLAQFVAAIKPAQQFWALQEKDSDNWVVIDSDMYEDCDVMPLWSSQQLAQSFCVEQWQDYVAQKISITQWLEFWVEDLSQDAVVVGVEWPHDGESVELELAEFTQAIAAIEKL